VVDGVHGNADNSGSWKMFIVDGHAAGQNNSG
jgi:hypothetical protein